MVKRKGKRLAVSPLQTNTSLINRAFFIVYIICTLLSIELAVVTRGQSIEDMLFWNGAYSDHFMDFFNTIRDSSDLTWVYQRSTIYPPLSVLIMHMFSAMIPHELAALPFADRYTMQFSQVCIMLFFLVAFFCVLLIAKMIERYMENAGQSLRARVMVTFFLILSFPMIYCLERGNTSLIALIGCAFFMFFRNSENKVVREISYIALALAAGIKMFPAVLGLLLIYDKNYKAAARTVAYGIAAVVLPYVIMQLITPETGGLAEEIQTGVASGQLDPEEYNSDGSAGRFFANLLSWINKRTYFTVNSTSTSNIAYLLCALGFIEENTASILGMVLFAVSEMVAFILGFFCKKEWQKLFIACYLMLNIHAVAMLYTLIYVLPVLVAFLCDKSRNEKKKMRLDWLYLCLFGIIFIPLPNFLYRYRDVIQSYLVLTFQINSNANLNHALAWIAFQLIFVLIIAELIVAKIRDKRAVRSAANAHAPARSAQVENARA